MQFRRALQILMFLACLFAGASIWTKTALLILELEATVESLPASV